MTDTTSDSTAATGTTTGTTTDARRAPSATAPHGPRPDRPAPDTATGTPAPAPTVPHPRRSPADAGTTDASDASDVSDAPYSGPTTPTAPAQPPVTPAPTPSPGAPRRTPPPPRRGTRRPTGPAGRGPGAAGNRGPTRTPYLSRTTPQHRPAPGPLPTPGARLRAQENRPHLWFAHQLLLALSGQRPVHVLLGHALPAAYDRLAELAPLSPLRPYVAPGLRAPVPALRQCGLCRPREGVIEAFARITTGARLRALAFRLERGTDARWRCAALDIGPLP
ncbi:Rv3235 family protein [Streptomyces sp. S186]|uniref:Rv3235 family protein n=1 Tax=Streptomyces sp. S186 TaxID=3434395 RepID=UPI003F661AC4